MAVTEPTICGYVGVSEAMLDALRCCPLKNWSELLKAGQFRPREKTFIHAEASPPTIDATIHVAEHTAA